MTRVKVAKWGNSLGLRLPRALVDEVGLEEGQIVELTARDGGIDVKPTNKVPRYQLAELLASKQDHQIFGATEFEVRDRVHRIGAEAIQTALEERKKRGTKVPAAAARTAKKGQNSNAGRQKRG